MGSLIMWGYNWMVYAVLSWSVIFLSCNIGFEWLGDVYFARVILLPKLFAKWLNSSGFDNDGFSAQGVGVATTCVLIECHHLRELGIE